AHHRRARLPARAHRGHRGPFPLPARHSLLSGSPRRCGGGLARAHPLRARPRPDRPLQGLPPAQAQDPGLHLARGRPLPHPAHPHARDLRHRPHGGARTRAQRGPDRGHRARARSRAPALRPHRRGRARPPPARPLRRRLSPQRALAAGRRAAGAGGEGPQPDRARAGRDRATHRARAAGHPRGPDPPPRRPLRLHQPRHRRRGPRPRAGRGRAAEDGARRARGDRLRAHRHARARPRRRLGRGRRHRPGRPGRRGDGEAAGLHVRARLPGRGGPLEARAHRAGPLHAVRGLRTATAGGADAGSLRARARDRLDRRHDRSLRGAGPRRAGRRGLRGARAAGSACGRAIV
ncbi:MAG: dNTP triphosphohydrolase, broad substrate specificity, partial [uncultured Solirubrobacterales bacterium]